MLTVRDSVFIHFLKSAVSPSVNKLLVLVFLQWTPLGFKMRDPDTLDDISKERFEGTVLKAISKNPRKEVKKDLEENEEKNRRGGDSHGQQMLLGQVKNQTPAALEILQKSWFW